MIGKRKHGSQISILVTLWKLFKNRIITGITFTCSVRATIPIFILVQLERIFKRH